MLAGPVHPGPRPLEEGGLAAVDERRDERGGLARGARLGAPWATRLMGSTASAGGVTPSRRQARTTCPRKSPSNSAPSRSRSRRRTTRTSPTPRPRRGAAAPARAGSASTCPARSAAASARARGPSAVQAWRSSACPIQIRYEASIQSPEWMRVTMPPGRSARRLGHGDGLDRVARAERCRRAGRGTRARSPGSAPRRSRRRGRRPPWAGPRAAPPPTRARSRPRSRRSRRAASLRRHARVGEADRVRQRAIAEEHGELAPLAGGDAPGPVDRARAAARSAGASGAARPRRSRPSGRPRARAPRPPRARPPPPPATSRLGPRRTGARGSRAPRARASGRPPGARSAAAAGGAGSARRAASLSQRSGRIGWW